jgi:hypothetical protein
LLNRADFGEVVAAVDKEPGYTKEFKIPRANMEIG